MSVPIKLGLAVITISVTSIVGLSTNGLLQGSSIKNDTEAKGRTKKAEEESTPSRKGKCRKKQKPGCEQREK